MVRLGLVGFPQSGRTTLFSALTGSAHADARPDLPHLAVLTVPDPRLERVQEVYASARAVPATVEIEDLPAISPPGAAHVSERGQTFAAMRLCDALVPVIRAFENDSVAYHRDALDPQRDLADVEAELLLADLDVAGRRAEHLRRDLQKPLPNKADLEAELAVLERCIAALEESRPIEEVDLKSAEEKRLRSFQFLSQKPRVVVFNVGEARARRPDPALEAVPHSTQICAALERDLAELDQGERADFMAEYQIGELSGPRLVKVAYEVLKAVTFFTAAEKEAHAWTITRGETAVVAAGKIHSDMARGFIRAEVVPFDQLDAAGSLKEAKARGQVRLEGRDYQVQDGDVLFIRFSV